MVFVRSTLCELFNIPDMSRYEYFLTEIYSNEKTKNDIFMNKIASAIYHFSFSSYFSVCSLKTLSFIICLHTIDICEILQIYIHIRKRCLFISFFKKNIYTQRDSCHVFSTCENVKFTARRDPNLFLILFIYLSLLL